MGPNESKGNIIILPYDVVTVKTDGIDEKLPIDEKLIDSMQLYVKPS